MSQVDRKWYDFVNPDYVAPEDKPSDGKFLYSGRPWKEMTVAEKVASLAIISVIVFFAIGTYFT